jgi:hypothetical protein
LLGNLDDGIKTIQRKKTAWMNLQALL